MHDLFATQKSPKRLQPIATKVFNAASQLYRSSLVNSLRRFKKGLALFGLLTIKYIAFAGY